MTEKKPFTHTAYAMKREGRLASRPLEIGLARVGENASGHHEIFVDRLPIGGFDGRIYLSPIGAKPPELRQEPQRPGQAPETMDSDEEI